MYYARKVTTALKFVLLLLFLAAALAPRFGFHLPEWMQTIRRVTTVIWIAVVLLAVYGALEYFRVI